MTAEKDNLHNLSRHKTKKTIEYVQRLKPTVSMVCDEIKRFNKIIKEALSKGTANEMLETIGYEPVKEDIIYSKVLTINNKKVQ